MSNKSAVFLIIFAAFQAMGLEVGEKAPCVVLEGFTSKGNPITRCIRDTENADQQYTVIDFAYTTCEFCTKGIPLLSELAVSSKSVLTVRVVLVDLDKEAMLNFLNQHKNEITFATALDFQQKALIRYGVSITPTTFVLNKDNDVVYKHEGEINEKTIEEIKEITSN